MGLSPSAPPSSLSQSSLTRGQARAVSQKRNVPEKLKRGIRRNFSGYLFLLPALLIFALFVWYPVVLGFAISFQNVDMINPSAWVGWANYHQVLTDPLFQIAWRNTLAFTGYALLFGYFIPILFALFVNEMRHGRGYFRLAFYVPVMLPPIVTVFLWRWIYNPDSGLLNALLSLLHLPPHLWLETPGTALPALHGAMLARRCSSILPRFRGFLLHSMKLQRSTVRISCKDCGM